MKAFVAIVLVCFALGVAKADVDREKAVKLYNDCKAKTGATESEEDIVDKKIIPTTDAGKCLIECALSTKGVWKDGKVDVEEAKKFAAKIHSDNNEKQEKFNQAIDECAKTSFANMDNCSAATAYYECTLNKAKSNP